VKFQQISAKFQWSFSKVSAKCLIST